MSDFSSTAWSGKVVLEGKFESAHVEPDFLYTFILEGGNQDIRCKVPLHVGDKIEVRGVGTPESQARTITEIVHRVAHSPLQTSGTPLVRSRID